MELNLAKNDGNARLKSFAGLEVDRENRGYGVRGGHETNGATLLFRRGGFCPGNFVGQHPPELIAASPAGSVMTPRVCPGTITLNQTMT